MKNKKITLYAKSVGFSALWIAAFEAMVFTLLIALMFIEYFVMCKYTGADAVSIQDLLQYKGYLLSLWANAFAAIGFLLFLLLKNKDKKSLFRIMDAKVVGFVVLASVVLNVASNFLLEILSKILPSQNVDSYNQAMDSIFKGNISPILILISVGILSPVMEEIVFRYGIQKNLSKINPIVAIVLQALLFGIVHGNLVQGSYAFLVGIVVGVIYYKTDNLLAPILFHITFNMPSVFVSIFGSSYFPAFLFDVSIILVAIVIEICINKKKNRKEQLVHNTQLVSNYNVSNTTVRENNNTTIRTGVNNSFDTNDNNQA